MFEKATRLKLRFETPVGLINVEDLWDLPLSGGKTVANLDDIARSLHRKLKNDDNVSFVVTEFKSDETVQLKFDIVKHVIDVKIVESAAAGEAKVRSEKKQQILSILADQEKDSLRNTPPEKLRELLASL